MSKENCMLFCIKWSKGVGIALQIFSYPFLEIITLYFLVKSWRDNKSPVESSKSWTNNTPLSNQSALKIDFLLIVITLLFHNKELCGEKLWVNIIFPKCNACLWKADNFIGILDISKSHLSKKSIPPILLNNLLGTWYHIDWDWDRHYFNHFILKAAMTDSNFMALRPPLS